MTPLNSQDKVVTNNPSGIVTINPSDTLGNNVQYYRFNGDNTVYQNSQFNGATPTNPPQINGGNQPTNPPNPGTGVPSPSNTVGNATNTAGGNNTGTANPNNSQFTGFVKSDSSPTVYGVDANGNYTAFSNAQDFQSAGGNFANVKTVPGFNPGVTPIFNQQSTANQVAGNPLAPAGIGNVPTTASGVPDYYKLYQQQLQQFGIGTGNPATDPNAQLESINQQIAQQQQVLAPLQMSNFVYPQALQPLQEGGANQAQLNLKAAQAVAPIQTAMSFLIQDRSAIAQYITNAQSFATNAVQQAQTTYETQLKLQQYDFTQIGSHVNELGQTVPDYGYVNHFTGKILPANQPNNQDITQPSYNIGGFPISIGTRPSTSNPNVVEYYNTQTGQGFSSPQALAEFVNKQTNNNTATAQNVFGLLNSAQNRVDTNASSITNTRTDRNYNPIAASVAVNADGTPNMGDSTTNEWLSALNKSGVNYSIEQGHNFGNRATISFANAQDGLTGAKTLLGTSAFYWYKNNTGKAELANVASPDAFKSLSDSQKNNIIKGIYSHEQPGGQMFTAGATSGISNSNIQHQIQALSPIFQRYIHTSPTGYAYTGPSTPDNFATAIAANKNAPDIIPLSPEQASNEDALVKAMGFVSQGQNLVNQLNLPTDPYDVKRLGNTWNQALQNDPKLAQLAQLWQASISVLQGLGTTGIRSQQLIEKSASSDFPTGSSIDSVARAQLTGLMNILQTEEKTVMGGRMPPVDYNAQAQNLLNGSVTNGSNTTYDSLNQIYANLSVGVANTSNINVLPPNQ